MRQENTNEAFSAGPVTLITPRLSTSCHHHCAYLKGFNPGPAPAFLAQWFSSLAAQENHMKSFKHTLPETPAPFSVDLESGL